MTAPAIRVQNLSKKFVLHNQGGAELPVLENIDLEVAPGECVVLDGPSGSGKSTLLKCLYANYRANTGTVHIREGDTETELGSATPRERGVAIVGIFHDARVRDSVATHVVNMTRPL